MTKNPLKITREKFSFTKLTASYKQFCLVLGCTSFKEYFSVAASKNKTYKTES